MLNKNDFTGKKVLIVGDGISGNGARDVLNGLGAECYLYDDKFGNFNNGIDYGLIVISPAIPKSHYIYEYSKLNNIPLIGEIELGGILFEGKIVAITGTNGKTTTTELVGEILKRADKKVSICGNIGKSFAKSVVEEASEYAALEVSSFQLESIDSFKPHIACILNISSDHLDRHKTMEEYVAQKLKIVKNQTSEDFLILSADDIETGYLNGFFPNGKVFYTAINSKVEGAYLLNNKIYFCGEFICNRDSIRLSGNHNVANALNAICACRLLGVPKNVIVDVLTEFTSGEHRIKHVDTINGISYFNDSKGTNIGATVKAAESMCGDTCLILGGSDKGYGFGELFDKLPCSVKKIYCIGETAGKIKEEAFKHNFFDVEFKSSIVNAVHDSQNLNVENVLLSPACASFDMFRNYKDRGEQFEKAVASLKNITEAEKLF